MRRRIAERHAAGRCQVRFGIGASLLFHQAIPVTCAVAAVVAVAISGHWPESFPRWSPPPQGATQVQLTATPLLVVAMPPEESDSLETFEMRLPDAWPPTSAPAPFPRPVDVSPMARMPTVQARSDGELLEPALWNVPSQRAITRRAAREPLPRESESAETAVPKRTRQHRQVAVATTVSLPTLAMQANRGADSKALPRQRFSPSPVYPIEAISAGKEGRTVLLAELDRQGHVSHIQVHESSGHAMLDEAAMQAVRTWRFEPAGDSWQDTADRIRIPIRFDIEDPSQRPQSERPQSERH